jgi:hypothetical protein
MQMATTSIYKVRSMKIFLLEAFWLSVEYTVDRFMIKILIGKPLHICSGTRTFIFMMKMLLRKKST